MKATALAIGALLHAVALAALLRAGPMGWTLSAHVAGALAWGWGANCFWPLPQRGTWWLPAGCALVFPVLGPLFSIVLGVQLRRPTVDRIERRYTVWSEQAHVGMNESLPASASGQSIVEILQSPRTQLRRNAVLALRELEPQMAIPLLRKGLQDSDEQVRIYAQNILSSMLERFEGGIKELEQRLDAEPHAAAHAVRLAEQYFELVYLDVAGDDETAAHYLQRAQALLTRAAAVSPDDREIAFQGMRYALRARDRAQARAWFERLN
ncbi:MAG: hypothetical protein EXS37_11320 [Opitutus sp.]|nr:hypothetical protein [Opitutus sp.]